MRHLFCKSIQIRQAAHRHSLSKVNELKFPKNDSLWVLLQVWRRFPAPLKLFPDLLHEFFSPTELGSLLMAALLGTDFWM